MISQTGWSFQLGKGQLRYVLISYHHFTEYVEEELVWKRDILILDQNNGPLLSKYKF